MTALDMAVGLSTYRTGTVTLSLSGALILEDGK